MKKLLSTIILFAILLSSFSMFAYADSADAANIRYVPTHIEITSSTIEVEGFFVNLDQNFKIGNFNNMELTVYLENTEICSDIFTEINQFMMPPMSVYFQSFTFANPHGSKINGSYDCDDTFYVVIVGTPDSYTSMRTTLSSGSTYYAGAANTDVADLIRFIPTSVEVTTSKTVVAGYFVNLNYNRTVSNFTKFNMSVFDGGDKLIEGSFGTINSFEIAPLGMKYQSFSFSGDYTNVMRPGKYTCGDQVYASFSCSFSSEIA